MLHEKPREFPQYSSNKRYWPVLETPNHFCSRPVVFAQIVTTKRSIRPTTPITAIFRKVRPQRIISAASCFCRYNSRTMYPMHTIRKNIHVAVLFEKNSERLPSCFAFSGNNSCKIPINLKLPNINSSVSRNRSIRSKLSQPARNNPRNKNTIAAKALSLFWVTTVPKPSMQYSPAAMRILLSFAIKNTAAPAVSATQTYPEYQDACPMVERNNSCHDSSRP